MSKNNSDIDIYPEDIINQVSEWGQNQTPISEMANRLKLDKSTRVLFIHHCMDRNHIVGSNYWDGINQGKKDMMSMLGLQAIGGDTTAAELILKVNKDDKVECLKYDLFGL